MEQGIHNPEMIDEVAFDPDNEELALIMYAEQDWSDSDARIDEMKAKATTYVQFALGGQLKEAFPDHADSKVRVQLNCKHLPNDQVMTFLEGLNEILSKGGMRMVVNCPEMQEQEPKS